MCTNNLKEAAKAATDFIFQSTNLDEVICVNAIKYVLHLIPQLDGIERDKVKSYLNLALNNLESAGVINTIGGINNG